VASRITGQRWAARATPGTRRIWRVRSSFRQKKNPTIDGTKFRHAGSTPTTFPQRPRRTAPRRPCVGTACNIDLVGSENVQDAISTRATSSCPGRALQCVHTTAVSNPGGTRGTGNSAGLPAPRPINARSRWRLSTRFCAETPYGREGQVVPLSV